MYVGMCGAVLTTAVLTNLIKIMVQCAVPCTSSVEVQSGEAAAMPIK